MPESTRVKAEELINVFVAMESMVALQSGMLHPDVKETEEEKARNGGCARSRNRQAQKSLPRTPRIPTPGYKSLLPKNKHQMD